MNIYNYLIQIILSGIGVITFIKTNNFMTNTFNARRAPLLTVITFTLFEVLVVTAIAFVKGEFYTDLMLDIIINAAFLSIAAPIKFYATEKDGDDMIREGEVEESDRGIVAAAVNVTFAICIICADIAAWSVFRLVVMIIER